MDEKSKVIGQLTYENEVYDIKVGDITVELKYSNNCRKFDECMLNILKQKI